MAVDEGAEEAECGNAAGELGGCEFRVCHWEKTECAEAGWIGCDGCCYFVVCSADDVRLLEGCGSRVVGNDLG